MEDPATSVTSSLWASLNSWFTSTVFFVLLNVMIATIVFTSNLPTNNHQQQQEDEHQQQEKQNQPPIARSPSILHRLKSLNFYPQIPHHHQPPPETHYHQHPIELAASQYVFNQPLEYQHFDLNHSDQIDESQPPATETETRVETTTDRYDSDPTHDENHRDATEEEYSGEFQSLDEVYSSLNRVGHDRTKSDGSIGAKPQAKMKKSASLKVGFSHLEEEDAVDRRRPATVKDKRPPAATVEDDDDVEVDSRADDFINKFKNDLKLQRIESIIRTKGTMNSGAGK